MTDAQILTLALAAIIPLSMLIYSNSRISEAKETLRAEMQVIKTEIKAGFEKLSTESAHIEQKLDRISETLSAVIGDHEQRLRLIEQRPR